MRCASFIKLIFIGFSSYLYFVCFCKHTHNRWDDWDEDEDEGTVSELVVECTRFAELLVSSVSPSADISGFVGKIGASTLTTRHLAVLEWLLSNT